MKRLSLRSVLLGALVPVLIFLPAAGVFAQAEADTKVAEPLAGPQGLVSNLSDKCISKGDCTLCDVVSVVDNVIQLVLGVVGSLALVAMIWGGFQIMLQVRDYKQRGFKTIQYAVIGLALVFFSYTIVNMTLNILIASGQEKEVNLGGPAQIFLKRSWADICATEAELKPPATSPTAPAATPAQ